MSKLESNPLNWLICQHCPGWNLITPEADLAQSAHILPDTAQAFSLQDCLLFSLSTPYWTSPFLQSFIYSFLPSTKRLSKQTKNNKNMKRVWKSKLEIVTILNLGFFSSFCLLLTNRIEKGPSLHYKPHLWVSPSSSSSDMDDANWMYKYIKYFLLWSLEFYSWQWNKWFDLYHILSKGNRFCHNEGPLLLTVYESFCIWIILCFMLIAFIQNNIQLCML